MTSDERTDGGFDAADVDADPDDETLGDMAEPRGAAQADADGAVPEDAIASPADFAHKRDADGDLLPVTQRVPGTQKYVRVRPITQAEANEYLPETGDPRAMADDEILALIHEFVIEPDLSHVEDVDDFLAFGVDPLLFAVMQASGFDMAKGMLTENADLAGVIEGNSSRGN